MIRSFDDKALEKFHDKGDPQGLSVKNTAKLRRMLDALDVADQPSGMNVPGWDFHQLKGQRQNTYSVKLTGNWRMTFEWDNGAINVKLEDYH